MKGALKYHPAYQGVTAAGKQLREAREARDNLPVIVQKKSGAYVVDGARMVPTHLLDKVQVETTIQGLRVHRYYLETENMSQAETFIPAANTRWPEQLGVVYQRYLTELRMIDNRGKSFESWLFELVRKGDYHLLPRKVHKKKDKTPRAKVVRRKFTFEHKEP